MAIVCLASPSDGNRALLVSPDHPDVKPRRKFPGVFATPGAADLSS
jgi:hypothetical protein